MDIYQILESLQRVEEGGMKHMLWDLAERLDREQFIDYTRSELGLDEKEMGEFWDSINGPLDEGSMASAEKHSTGPKFTGYWKGTDPRTPGKHMVGGAAEGVEECNEPASLMDKLKARWEKTKQEKGLAEAGANNTAPNTAGTPGATPTDPAQDAKKIAQTQKGINLMKAAGVQVPSVQQAVKSTLKDPATDPADMQDKKVASAFGQAAQNIIKSGDPSSQNQLAALIKKAGMSGAQ